MGAEGSRQSEGDGARAELWAGEPVLAGKPGSMQDELLGQESIPDSLGCRERPISERCFRQMLPPGVA